MEEKSLIENMYRMITVFRHYKITPVFVFDGKPPKEKEELIQKRKIQKKLAEERYLQLKQGVDSIDDIQPEIAAEMEKLRRQFIRIHPNDIKEVKTLMDLYGVEYLDAEGEADKVCVKMVLDKKAWACVSDDMDMFVYGCKRVIRNINLLQHTAIYYNLDNILRDLQLPLQDFREIMILSGTDYNLHQKVTLHKSLKYYQDFKQSVSSDNLKPEDDRRFYEWLSKNRISNAETLYEIYNMFIMDDDKDQNKYMLVKSKKTVNWTKLREFLVCYGFVFM
jgi:5'-3' exonuclease